MKKAISNQKSIRFVWCPKPVAITASWGLQEAPDGAFLKLQDDFVTVSHLVQPNADKTAPIGWEPIYNPENGELIPGFFDKKDIWVADVVLENQQFNLKTADGPMSYDITEPSYIVCNDKNGEPDLEDSWVMTVATFSKNYVLSE